MKSTNVGTEFVHQAIRLLILLAAVVFPATWIKPAIAQSALEPNYRRLVALVDSFQPQPVPPQCGETATVGLGDLGSGIFTLNVEVNGSTTATSQLVGVFTVDPSTVVTFVEGQPVAVGAFSGTGQWQVMTGTVVLTDGSTFVAGLFRSTANMTDPLGNQLAIDAGTIMPAQAVQTFSSLLTGASIILDEPGSEVASVGPALGSSCSCPTCPNGMTFRVPFFTVLINNTAGQGCCAAACNVGCGALLAGKSPYTAWFNGQGTFVTCMVCA